MDKFNDCLRDIIKNRCSVRSYDGNGLNEEVVSKIENYISNITNPFDKYIRIILIKPNLEENKPLKLGTYGMIKGAKYFLGVVCKNEDFNLEALGYTFEKVVLFLTELGLGTCWMGGTFSKGQFAKAMNLKNDEVLPIISPVGYQGGKPGILGKFASKSSSKRKDFEELFFNENFETPIDKSSIGRFEEVLENIRLAPSAMNKQPWRILKEGDNYHFYNEGKLDMNRIDMGIAMCHFHLTTIEKGIDGEFKVKKDRDKDRDKDNSKYKYIISWINK